MYPPKGKVKAQEDAQPMGSAVSDQALPLPCAPAALPGTAQGPIPHY